MRYSFPFLFIRRISFSSFLHGPRINPRTDARTWRFVHIFTSLIKQNFGSVNNSLQRPSVSDSYYRPFIVDLCSSSQPVGPDPANHTLRSHTYSPYIATIVRSFCMYTAFHTVLFSFCILAKEFPCFGLSRNP